MISTDTHYDPEQKQSRSRGELKAQFEFGQESFYRVILCIGQSVMEGGGPALATLEVSPGEPDGSLDNVFMLSKAGDIVPAKAPTSELAPGLSVDPAHHIGKHLRARGSRAQPLLIVNRAVGGTSFSENNWNPGDPEFTAAVASLGALFARTDIKCYLEAIFWIQGESDSNAATDEPRDLLSKLEPMVGVLRGGGAQGIADDYLGGHRNKPFVLATINDEFDSAPIEVNCSLYQLERRVPWTAVVPIQDLNYNEEGAADWHLTADGTRNAGARMANAVDRARSNVSVGSISPQLPPYDYRVRAASSTLTFGDLALDTPIENTGPGIEPQLSAVVTGGSLVGGIGGDPRGSVIGHLLGGFSVTNIDFKPEGYTIAGWVFLNAVAANHPFFAPPAIKSGGSADDPGWLCRFDHVPDADATIGGTLRRAYSVRMHHAANGLYMTKPVIYSSQWAHVAIVGTYQESGAVGSFNATTHVFVNGEYQGGRDQAPLLASGADISGGVHFGITANEFAGALNGFVDEVTHWPAPLSPSQVQLHYRSTMSGHTTLAGTGGIPTGFLSS